jgi:hypothetical protein
MITRTTGTSHPSYFQPLWAGENEGANAGGEQAAGGEQKAGEPDAGNSGGAADQNGSVSFDAGKAFEGLEADNLEWLQKVGLKEDPKALAKHAYNQEKLLGNALRIPGKDATPEEREAFLEKLGRPKTPDQYELPAPKDMPKELPYDGEREKVLRGLAHKLGLNNEQTVALRDAYIADEVGRFNGSAEAKKAATEQKATKATEELVKLWGPLDGETAAANFEIADKVFTQTPGGPEVLAELKAIGLVGPNKEILSVPLAKMFSAIGTALYTEDGLLRGRPDAIGNPFSDGEGFNVTKQMAMVKNDPDQARSMIAAAGKKAAEFGL